MQGDAARVSGSLAWCCALLYIQTPALWKVLLPGAKSYTSSKCIQNQGLLSLQLSIQSFPYKLPVNCRVLYFLKVIIFCPVHWLLFVPGKFLVCC